jgi:uncharacterized protein YndB with AHSA1/START domain
MTPAPVELGEFTYTSVLTAPRELVFRCMTEPAHLARFWGPDGTSTPQQDIVVDLRPGGVFQTVMVNDADGSRHTMHAVFVTVALPEKLVWTEPGAGGMTTSITFTDLGDGRTEVVTHQTNVPAPFATPQARAGMRTSFVRFAAYLATLPG